MRILTFNVAMKLGNGQLCVLYNMVVKVIQGANLVSALAISV